MEVFGFAFKGLPSDSLWVLTSRRVAHRSGRSRPSTVRVEALGPEVVRERMELIGRGRLDGCRAAGCGLFDVAAAFQHRDAGELGWVRRRFKGYASQAQDI